MGPRGDAAGRLKGKGRAGESGERTARPAWGRLWTERAAARGGGEWTARRGAWAQGQASKAAVETHLEARVPPAEALVVLGADVRLRGDECLDEHVVHPLAQRLYVVAHRVELAHQCVERPLQRREASSRGSERGGGGRAVVLLQRWWAAASTGKQGGHPACKLEALRPPCGLWSRRRRRRSR
eukprot:1211534-Prymnesium_polylepis.1